MVGIDTEALAEVDAIFAIMPREDYIKIPSSLKKFIREGKSKQYVTNIRKDIPLYQQNLKTDTKIMCSLIYRSYLCSKAEKKKFENDDRQYFKKKEQELKEQNML